MLPAMSQKLQLPKRSIWNRTAIKSNFVWSLGKVLIFITIKILYTEHALQKSRVFEWQRRFKKVSENINNAR